MATHSIDGTRSRMRDNAAKPGASRDSGRAARARRINGESKARKSKRSKRC